MASGPSWGQELSGDVSTLAAKWNGAWWRRHGPSLCIGLVLLLAFVLPVFMPQWYVLLTEYLRAHLLFTGALGLALLGLVLWKLPQWQVVAVRSVAARTALELKARQSLVHMCAGVSLLLGLYYAVQTLSPVQTGLQMTQETLRLAQQGHVAERIARAMETLADKERLTVRLGGIYALEQLAQESAQSHWQIMEVLTAYVRDNAPWPSKDIRLVQAEPAWQEKQPEESKRVLDVPPRFSASLGTDIQAVLTVLGRRTRTYGKGESQRLNLSNTALPGARLEGAHLEGSDLQGAHLQGAYLQGAYLQGARLHKASLGAAFLGAAHLVGVSLRGADLANAHLPRAYLSDANLQGAHLGNTELWGADLRGADLRGSKALTQQQVNMTCVDERTQLPEGLSTLTPCRATPP